MKKPSSSKSSGSSSSSSGSSSGKRPVVRDEAGKKLKRVYVTDAITKKRVLQSKAFRIKGKWYAKKTTRKLVRDGKTMIPRTSTPIPERVKEDYYTWAVNFLFEKILTEANTQKMFVKLYHFVLTLLINLSFSGFLKFISYIQIARRLKYYKETLLGSKRLQHRLQFVLKWVKWLYYATKSKEDMSYSYAAPQKSPSVGNFDRVKHSSQKRIEF